MDKEAENRKIMDRFMRLAHQYDDLEKTLRGMGRLSDTLPFGTSDMLDKVGENPGINVTEFA